MREVNGHFGHTLGTAEDLPWTRAKEQRDPDRQAIKKARQDDPTPVLHPSTLPASHHALPQALPTAPLPAVLQCSPLAGSSAATPLPSARRNHSGPSPAAAAEDDFCSPTIAAGKMVWDADEGQMGEVLELGPGGATGGKTPVKRWWDTKHLVMLPVLKPRGPQIAGQRVLINCSTPMSPLSKLCLSRIEGHPTVVITVHHALDEPPRVCPLFSDANMDTDEMKKKKKKKNRLFARLSTSRSSLSTQSRASIQGQNMRWRCAGRVRAYV